MRSLLLVLLLFTFPAPSQAELLCRDILSDSIVDDSSTLLPQFLGIKTSVEDLILSGPFQDAALELTELFLQINNPEFIVRLSHAFQFAEYDAQPGLNPNSNWYAWKAQFSLQNPHVNLQPADWVRLWNIYGVLDQQFSQSWSPSQIAWMSAWLLKVVSPEHFMSQKTIETTPITNGPLNMLQDPLLHEIYEQLISDSTFKAALLKIINQIQRYNPSLKQLLRKPTVTLTTSLDSQVLVSLTFQILFDRLKNALNKVNWRSESRSGIFVPDNMDSYLEDLFASPQNLERTLDLLRNIFMGTPIPIIENELQALLLASLKQQMRPIIDEALVRGSRPPTTAAITSAPIVSSTPLPLAEYMNELVEQQIYTFTISRSQNLGLQTLVFTRSSLALFKTENLESPAKFMQALQNGFTDTSGDNGIKKLLTDNYYEIRPGRSTYRMVILRSGNTWTVLATVHKDEDVNKFAEKHASGRASSRGGR